MKIKKVNELNSINENFHVGIIKQFLEEVTGESDLDAFTKATYDQISEIHHNASSSRIYYNDEYLIFTSESTLKNWQYYAGYEYIDDEPDMIRVNGEFLAIYSEDIDERISDDLEILNGEE